MSTKIATEQLSTEISKDLNLYSRYIVAGIKKEAQKSIKLLVAETKKTAPLGRREIHYKYNIASKKIEETYRSVRYAWYVDGPDYRLSHLLENGHAKKNGGRVEGTHFIKKASDPIIEQYVKAVEEVIKRG